MTNLTREDLQIIRGQMGVLKYRLEELFGDVADQAVSETYVGQLDRIIAHCTAALEYDEHRSQFHITPTYTDY